MIYVTLFWLLFNLALIPASYRLRACFAEDDAPRSCPTCGCCERVDKVRDSDPAWGVYESEAFCANCRTSVGYWAHGYWDPSYRDDLRREYLAAAALLALCLTAAYGLFDVTAMAA
ncbi:hypothetical protein D3C78_552890 [compost metagenome]